MKKEKSNWCLLSHPLFLTLSLEIIFAVVLYIAFDSVSGGEAPWRWDQEDWGFAIVFFGIFVLPILVIVMLVTAVLFWFWGAK
jgi:ribose/xylose/arabinose/galactoside ABC-type transport system permease subunit